MSLSIVFSIPTVATASLHFLISCIKQGVKKIMTGNHFHLYFIMIISLSRKEHKPKEWQGRQQGGIDRSGSKVRVK